MEADPRLVGQARDPLRPQHRRELAKQAWQAPGWYDRDTVEDDLAPGDLGAVDATIGSTTPGSVRIWAA